MAQHVYYYARINRALRFLIPQNSRVLYFGKTVPGVIPDILGCLCQVADPDAFEPTEPFDFIVLNCVIGESPDICGFLKKIARACTPSTRLIIYQHNYLWEGFLNLAGRLGLKDREKTQNWLSIADLKMILAGMAFEPVWTYRQTACPVRAGILGPALNGLADALPFADFLKLDQYVVARLRPEEAPRPKSRPSLTVCITVKNEKDNIEPIVAGMETVCENQEILFVEGHSTDGTREEIERVAAKYPGKNVRVTGQPGKGQGDAIRVGFKQARGDVIILYEGDGTSEPGDVAHFYEAIASGRCEFIEGSRFIYPFNQKAMPLANKAGNIFFAKWFSWFLGRNVTDVLSGIKAIKKSDYEKIHATWGFLGVEDPFGDFEVLYGAMRHGLHYGEIPMHYRPRPYGESKTRVYAHGMVLLKMALRGFWAFRTMRPSPP